MLRTRLAVATWMILIVALAPGARADDGAVIPFLAKGDGTPLNIWTIEYGLISGVSSTPGAFALGVGTAARFSVIDIIVRGFAPHLPVHFGDIIGLDCFVGGETNDQGLAGTFTYLRFHMDVGAQVLVNVSQNFDLGVEAAFIFGGSTLPGGWTGPHWAGLRMRYGDYGLSAALGYGNGNSWTTEIGTGLYWRGGIRAYAGKGDYFELRLEHFGATSAAASMTEGTFVVGTW